MRIIVGYQDGRAVWSENVPASVEMQGYGGHAIEARPSEMDRHRADAARNREKVRALRGSKLK